MDPEGEFYIFAVDSYVSVVAFVPYCISNTAVLV